MTFTLKIAGSLALIGALTACGSNGSDDTPPPTTGGSVTYTSFAEISADADALSSTYVEDDGTLLAKRTLEAELPTTGAVEYNGFISVSDDMSGENLVGQIALTADFDAAADAISGTASNFIHETNVVYTGDLTVTDGEIRANAPTGDYQFRASLEGQLSDGVTTYDTVIGLDGNFLGTDYSAIGGEALGLVGADFMSGNFAAEQ